MRWYTCGDLLACVSLCVYICVYACGWVFMHRYLGICILWLVSIYAQLIVVRLEIICTFEKGAL